MGFGLPGDINQMYGDLEGDEDLEAELAALTGQVTSPQKTAAKKGKGIDVEHCLFNNIY